ncbi:MAG: coenzyme F420-0:L-glutamate ligase [Angelakisella sp.]
MERLIGTVSRGIRAPIIREGDDLSSIVTNSVIDALASENIEIHNRDIVAVTEAVLGRAQGNYATVENIAADVRAKFGGGTVGVIFPILSRNRFSILLRGIAKGSKKIVLMLSYPSDEVGNHLVDMDLLDEKGVNPWRDVLTEAQFREKFGKHTHEFTGVDYIEYYGDLIREAGAESEIIFANNAVDILKYTSRVLCCDIHTRARSKRLLKAAGAELVLGMDEILTASVNGSGFNPDYGLLGANKATEDRVKLFPRDCDAFVRSVQAKLLERTGKKLEVMVYGDGAFKDPVGKIWELADPVVSPGYTDGLEGQPNEVKLKYLADNQFANLKGQELKDAISDFIRKKDNDLTGQMVSQGTTPRRLTDLIGSLCDLTSGSGDKGTPIVYIQGYFDNYTN